MMPNLPINLTQPACLFPTTLIPARTPSPHPDLVLSGEVALRIPFASGFSSCARTTRFSGRAPAISASTSSLITIDRENSQSSAETIPG
jgi:hypothetical protein